MDLFLCVILGEINASFVLTWCPGSLMNDLQCSRCTCTSIPHTKMNLLPGKPQDRHSEIQATVTRTRVPVCSRFPDDALISGKICVNYKQSLAGRFFFKFIFVNTDKPSTRIYCLNLTTMVRLPSQWLKSINIHEYLHRERLDQIRLC